MKIKYLKPQPGILIEVPVCKKYWNCLFWGGPGTSKAYWTSAPNLDWKLGIQKNHQFFFLKIRTLKILVEHSAIEAGQDLHHIFQRHMSGRIKKHIQAMVVGLRKKTSLPPLEIDDGWNFLSVFFDSCWARPLAVFYLTHGGFGHNPCSLTKGPPVLSREARQWKPEMTDQQARREGVI